MLKYPIVGQTVFKSSSTQDHPLGTLGYDRFGRKFRYSLAGASALVVGNVIQAPAQVGNHQDLTPTATAIGSKTIAVTLGNSAATANQYAGGFAIVSVTPGLGYAYPISGHPAADASASLTVTLQAGWEVAVALTTTSRIILSPNPYRGVIQSPVTTLTNACVGGCVYIIAASEYGWIQTGGPGAALIIGTPGVGLAVGPPGTAAGGLAINSSTNPIVAYMMDTGQDGVVCPVYWILD